MSNYKHCKLFLKHKWVENKDHIKQCSRCHVVDGDSFWGELNRLWDKKFGAHPVAPNKKIQRNGR